MILSSVPGPFLMADKELGCSRELLDLFKRRVVKFACVVFQVQDNGAYSLGIDDNPNAIDLFIFPFW